MAVNLTQAEPTSLFARVYWIVRAVLITVFAENVFCFTRFWQGHRNPQADVEGPAYIIGSPNREIEKGKAILAPSSELLKAQKSYLLTLTVRTPKGDPIPHVKFDFWQANNNGEYYVNTYGLRGKFTSDANGKVEILTVAPGKYGLSESLMRAGHFHLKLSSNDKQWEDMTSQLYVCRANDTKDVGKDFVNYMRPARPNNMVPSWSVALPNGEKYMDFPVLDAGDKETVERIHWWNGKLKELDLDVKVVAGAQYEIRMNAPPAWKLF